MVAVLFLTAALTLAVAGLTLLSPLERRLRDSEVRSLAGAAIASRPTFEELSARTMRPGSPRLRRVAAELGRRAQARVAVLDAQGHRLFDTDPDQGPAVADALAALHSSRPIRRIVPGGAFGEAQVAARVKAGHRAYVVALRKRLNDIGSTENAVVSALTRAALVGLAAAILLGVGFATAMLRRLRRLRDAAIRFGGPDGDPEPEIDDRDDELGDLSRAFADMQARLARQESSGARSSRRHPTSCVRR
jgi:methyl-accepting chemotaxis protein